MLFRSEAQPLLPGWQFRLKAAALSNLAWHWQAMLGGPASAQRSRLSGYAQSYGTELGDASLLLMTNRLALHYNGEMTCLVICLDIGVGDECSRQDRHADDSFSVSPHQTFKLIHGRDVNSDARLIPGLEKKATRSRKGIKRWRATTSQWRKFPPEIDTWVVEDGQGVQIRARWAESHEKNLERDKGVPHRITS